MSGHLSQPPVDPPWRQLDAPDIDRSCARCGEVIPAMWRHYMRPCPCTYHPTDRPPHAPDPACDTCAGCGFLPCQPQDLSVLRVSGRCATCHHPAFYLVSYLIVAEGPRWGEVPDSMRHYDAGRDEDHPAAYESAPLADAIAGHLEREIGPRG